MANFDYKKFLKENKSTFHSTLTEGQFSWMTQDTGQQIGSQEGNTIPVYMFDNTGKYWFEPSYDGYGEFGGKDYYELLDQMNGGKGDRSKGIDLAFDKAKIEAGQVLFPALVVGASNFNYKTHDFTQEAETDPNQSWLPYEEEDEDDWIMSDEEDEYGYDDEEEELDEAQLPALELDQVQNIAQQVADEFTKYENELDLKFSITPDSVEASPKGAGFDLDIAAGPNTPGDDWKDENGFGIDNYLGKFAGGSYIIKPEGDKHKIYNAATGNSYVGYVTPQGEVVFEYEKSMNEAEKAPKSNKMKKSELKELIKSSIIKEIALDVDSMENAPEDEVDFLAEIEAILAEADEEVAVDDTEVAVDGEENIDVDTTTEVDPNVKAVQDALTQAQAAAQKLGDPKLTDQIGNTITFFTRAHVVDKGAVAEGEEMELSNMQYVLDWWEELPFETKKEIFHQYHEDEDASNKYKGAVAEGDLTKKIGKGLEYEETEEKIRDYADRLLGAGVDDVEDLANFYLDNPEDLPEPLEYEFFKNNFDDILSVAMTGLDEGKKEYYKDAEADDAEHIKALEKDMEDDKKSSMNESMFPLLKRILK